MTIKRTSLLAVALAGLVGLAGTAHAGPIETMERERAQLLDAMLSPTLGAEERQERVGQSVHRLVDLERIVLRDKSVAEDSSPVVRKAFENYDLTFLVHASTEKDLVLIDHWLENCEISTPALMNARVGQRW